MEEYSFEFEKLIINGDLQESEEQLIARHRVSLRFDIARVIFMQPYNTLEDVIKLALKVEALNKYRSSTTIKSVAKEGFVEGSTSWNPSGTKTTHTQVKSEAQQEFTSKSKMCFKYQGLRHIDSECSNQKVIALIEEDEIKEEDVEGIESNHVQNDEEKRSLLKKSELEKEVKVGYDVIDLVVVQEIESEKEVQ